MSACMGRWTCAVGVLWLLSHAADHNERASISAVAVLWSDGQPTGPCVRVMRLVASLCVYMCVSLCVCVCRCVCVCVCECVCVCRVCLFVRVGAWCGSGKTSGGTRVRTEVR